MTNLSSVFDGYISTETLDFISEKASKGTELVVKVFSNKFVLVGTGIVVGLYWYGTRTHGFFKNLGIPGPKPGFWGALGDYRKKGLHVYDREVMKKYGKVVGIYHMSLPVYMVADAELIRQITVKEFSNFVNHDDKGSRPEDPLFKDSLVMLHDDEWRLMRTTLSPAFTSGRLKEMVPLIDKCVASLVENIWKTSEYGTKAVKMREIFGLYTMDTIASSAFGVDTGCQGDPKNAFVLNVNKIVNPGFRAILFFLLFMTIPGMKKFMEWSKMSMIDPGSSAFFNSAVREVIRRRQEESEIRSDFLQLMLTSHKLEENKEDDPDTQLVMDRRKRKGMTDNEIIANAMLFIIAGYEATSLALSFMAYNLAVNQDVQDRLIKEIDSVLNGRAPNHDNVLQLKYLENVLLETLRVNPPAVRLSRMTKEDITINGTQFKKGVEIHIPVYAVHHDPDYWTDPDVFNPDRFLPENRPENMNYVFLAFGAGPRNCIGMRLFYLEAKMAMAALLQKYRFKTGPETKIPIDFNKMTIKPNDGIMLRIEKR